MTTSARIALVVGGASGIGAATARALEADGCTVVVADRTAVDGVVPVDVTDEASVQALFARVVDEHGRLDVVVNSAGVSTFGLMADLAVEEFRTVVDVNLTGSFLVVKHAAPHLEAGGSIILVSSLNGRQAGAALAPYCAAKAGVNMLTQVAALELGARGIRVNAIAPGTGRDAADRAGDGHPRCRGRLPGQHPAGALRTTRGDRGRRGLPQSGRVDDRGGARPQRRRSPDALSGPARPRDGGVRLINPRASAIASKTSRSASHSVPGRGQWTATSVIPSSA